MGSAEFDPGLASNPRWHLSDGSVVNPPDIYGSPGITVDAAGNLHVYNGGQMANWFALNADPSTTIATFTVSGLAASSAYAATLTVRVYFRKTSGNSDVSSVDFAVDLYITTDGASVATVAFQTTPSPDPSRLKSTIMNCTATAAAAAGGFSVAATRQPTIAMEARCYFWVTEFIRL